MALRELLGGFGEGLNRGVESSLDFALRRALQAQQERGALKRQQDLATSKRQDASTASQNELAKLRLLAGDPLAPASRVSPDVTTTQELAARQEQGGLLQKLQAGGFDVGLKGGQFTASTRRSLTLDQMIADAEARGDRPRALELAKLKQVGSGRDTLGIAEADLLVPRGGAGIPADGAGIGGGDITTEEIPTGGGDITIEEIPTGGAVQPGLIRRGVEGLGGGAARIGTSASRILSGDVEALARSTAPGAGVLGIVAVVRKIVDFIVNGGAVPEEAAQLGRGVSGLTVKEYVQSARERGVSPEDLRQGLIEEFAPDQSQGLGRIEDFNLRGS